MRKVRNNIIVVNENLIYCRVELNEKDKNYYSVGYTNYKGIHGYGKFKNEIILGLKKYIRDEGLVVLSEPSKFNKSGEIKIKISNN